MYLAQAERIARRALSPLFDGDETPEFQSIVERPYGWIMTTRRTGPLVVFRNGSARLLSGLEPAADRVRELERELKQQRF
jgi:hypothetical protein